MLYQTLLPVIDHPAAKRSGGQRDCDRLARRLLPPSLLPCPRNPLAPPPVAVFSSALVPAEDQPLVSSLWICCHVLCMGSAVYGEGGGVGGAPVAREAVPRLRADPSDLGPVFHRPIVGGLWQGGGRHMVCGGRGVRGVALRGGGAEAGDAEI